MFLPFLAGSLTTYLLANGKGVSPGGGPPANRVTFARFAHGSPSGYRTIQDPIRHPITELLPSGTRVGLAVFGRGTLVRGEGLISGASPNASWYRIAWIREFERVGPSQDGPYPAEMFMTSVDGIARVMPPRTTMQAQARSHANVANAPQSPMRPQAQPVVVKLDPAPPAAFNLASIKRPEALSSDATKSAAEDLESRITSAQREKLVSVGDGGSKIAMLRTKQDGSDLDLVLFQHEGKASVFLSRGNDKRIFDAMRVHAALTQAESPKEVRTTMVEGPIHKDETSLVGIVGDCGEGDIRAFGIVQPKKGESSIFADTATTPGPRVLVPDVASWLLSA